MIDFSALRKANKSLVMDSADPFEEYKKWASEQVCSGCGAKASERPRNDEGFCLDVWITETLCGKCWKKI